MLPEHVTLIIPVRRLTNGLLLSPLAVLLCWWVAGWSWDSAAAPAWVQAFGSIGAIIAAVWIARRGVLQQQAERLLDSYYYLEKAFRIALHGAEIISKATEDILEGPPSDATLDFHVAQLDVVLRDLEEVDSMLLEDPECADAFLCVRRYVSMARITIAAELKEKDFDGYDVASWKDDAHMYVDRMAEGTKSFLERHPQIKGQLPEGNIDLP